MVEEDMLSLAASWDEDSFPKEMEEEEPEPSTVAEHSSEIASETSLPPLMGRCKLFADPLGDTVRAPSVCVLDAGSGSHSAVLSTVPLFYEGGAVKLSLTGFPPVDSTIAALVKVPPVGGLSRDPVCPNPQYRVMETHLKRAYAVEVQVTHLANTVGILNAYLDGVLTETPLPEPVATELRLLSSMLFQISGLQGQALGQILASLVLAHRQLWLSQARVSDTDMVALLDAPTYPGYTFGPAVEEILQRSLRQHKASWQVAALLPTCALVWGRSRHWQAPLVRTITKMVPVPTAPLGDLRHRLQATAPMGNRAPPQSTRNAGRGVSMQQHSRRVFQGHWSRQLPRSDPPQPQQPHQGPEGLRPQTHSFTSSAILARLHLGHLGARYRAQRLHTAVPFGTSPLPRSHDPLQPCDGGGCPHLHDGVKMGVVLSLQVVMTDTSKLGWGVVREGREVCGTWLGVLDSPCT
ncbi:UNVERIFIED_CONTAM: hypothetical protein FKN15_033227 [Acipenser sinensis]